MTNVLPQPGAEVVAPVQSAVLSKTIWTQVIGFAASWAAVKGFNVPPEAQVTIVLVIQGVVAALTTVLKTWFTPSVTPSSAAVLPKV